MKKYRRYNFFLMENINKIEEIDYFKEQHLEYIHQYFL